MDKHCKKHTSKPKHRSRSQLTLAGFETPFEGIFNPNLDKPEPNKKKNCNLHYEFTNKYA